MGPTHFRVVGLITGAYFFDVIDYIILGSLVPDMVRSQFATAADIGTIGAVTIFGLFVGAAGQGEFTDRLGRKAVFHAGVLLYGLATIAAALAPSAGWLAFGRFVAGIGFGAAQPLCFAYAAEYAPKAIRGRITAFMQFVGGACVWPIGTLFAVGFRDSLGWRGIWLVIGCCALIVFLFSFALPESPRWLVTHGPGRRALDLLERMGLGKPPNVALTEDAIADIRSDPIGVVFRLDDLLLRLLQRSAWWYSQRLRAWLRVMTVIAVLLALATIAVTQISSETKGLALDTIAPPTR